MNPDQVIKEAIEKLDIARRDTFILGAFRTFKEAGATDEEAAKLVKKHMALAKVAALKAAK